MNFEHVHLPGIFAAIDYNLLPTRYTCLSFTLRVVCVCVSVFVYYVGVSVLQKKLYIIKVGDFARELRIFGISSGWNSRFCCLHVAA